MQPEVIIPRKKPVDKHAESRLELPVPVLAPTPQKEPGNVRETEVMHPFTNVPDATYVPPVNRNYAAPKPQPPKKADPAYKTSVPIYDRKVTTDIYDRAMDAQVMLTQHELLSLSPEVCVQVHEATSNKHVVPGKEAPKGINVLANNLALPMALDNLNDDNNEPVAATFINSVMTVSQPPPGSLIIPDPYETYLKMLLAGAIP